MDICILIYSLIVYKQVYVSESMVQVVYCSGINYNKVDSQNKLCHLFIIFCRSRNLSKPPRYNTVTGDGRMPRQAS